MRVCAARPQWYLKRWNKQQATGIVVEKNTAEKIAGLRKIIRSCDAAYYGRGESPVSDAEYDALYHQLVELEKRYPELVTTD